MNTTEATNAILGVDTELRRVMEEAIQTYGMSIAMAALATTVAFVLHDNEHHTTQPDARRLILSTWEGSLKSMLDFFHAECDASWAPRDYQ